MKFYFTFPNKYPKLRSKYVELDGMPDVEMARRRISSSVVGMNFAFQYDEEGFAGQAAKWGLSRIALSNIHKSHFVTEEENTDEHRRTVERESIELAGSTIILPPAHAGAIKRNSYTPKDGPGDSNSDD